MIETMVLGDMELRGLLARAHAEMPRLDFEGRVTSVDEGRHLAFRVTNPDWPLANDGAPRALRWSLWFELDTELSEDERALFLIAMLRQTLESRGIDPDTGALDPGKDIFGSAS